MAKISEETRLHFAEVIKPYKERISLTLEKEKTMLNGMHDGDVDLCFKKLLLCDDMIYISSLYMAQNSLSLKLMDVKNNDALNDARKILYKAIIYLEEIVTNIIDTPYSELTPYHEKMTSINIKRRYEIVQKLGLAINMLKDAFGDNSKWKWSFVELEGRFATVAKNLIDMKSAVKDYFDPRAEDYETTVLYMRAIIRLLNDSATAYRDKYELSTRRIDDMRNGIKYLLALRKLYLAIGDSDNAEEVKKKALVWKDKMDADHKAGLSN
jgi:tetratricopeptide (TPR) repeat protein